MRTPKPNSYLGHRASEALASGRFPDALELIHAHLKETPDDAHARLVEGKILTMLGRLEDAARAYAEFALRGGNPSAAAEHFVSSVAALEETAALSSGFLFDEDALIARCRVLWPATLRDEIPRVIAARAGEWNRFRKNLPRRREHYRRVLDFRGRESDFLLIVPPCFLFGAGYPPYGAGVLMHYLERRGEKCILADINLALYEAVGEPWSAWWQKSDTCRWVDPFAYLTHTGLLLRPDAEFLAEWLAQAVTRVYGLACFSTTRFFVLQFLPALKRAKPEALVALGGPDCFYPNQGKERYASVSECLDVFVLGEGEASTLAYLEAVKEGKNPAGLPGLLVPGQNETLHPFRARDPIGALDLAGFHKYDSDYIARIPVPRIRLIGGSRGCVNHCDFCYDRIAWQKFRLREPADVIAEIAYNVERYGIRTFNFVDTCVNASPKHLERFCDLLLESGLQVNLSASVMVSEKMTPALYEKMHGAGFHSLCFGIESGSTTVLNAIGKRGGAAEAERNLRMASEAGMANRIFIIVGHPDERKKEYGETLRFLDRNKRYFHVLDLVNHCQILQNTTLVRKLHERGVQMPEGWQELVSWSLGDNTLEERMRRKSELLAFAKRKGIPFNPCEEIHLPAEKSGLFARLRRNARRILFREP